MEVTSNSLLSWDSCLDHNCSNRIYNSSLLSLFVFIDKQAGLLYIYSSVAVNAAKSNAKRLREQDGGTLDLHRQSLRQHGLLHDQHRVGPHSPPVGGIDVPANRAASASTRNEEAIRAESRRRKEDARARELEAMKKAEKERYSLWNWIRGK